MSQSNTVPRHTPRPFTRLSIERLLARMNRALDFGYDDESQELHRRLRPTGRAWRWTQSDPPRVEIYSPAAGIATEKDE